MVSSLRLRLLHDTDGLLLAARVRDDQVIPLTRRVPGVGGDARGAAPWGLLPGRGHAAGYFASARPAGQEKLAGMDHSWKEFVSSAARK